MAAWSRRAFQALAAAALAATALLCTWPLCLHLGSAIPLGTETAPTIPVFDVWTLWWSADRFAHGYVDLWNAPIFHPTPGTFAFSEPLLLPGALAAPLFALGLPAALVHNVILLAALVGNGAFAGRLLRALAVPRLPALLGGMLMVALPFVAKLQGELPLVCLAGFIAALDGLVRFEQGGGWRPALQAGGALLAQALLCQQLALLALPFATGAGLVALAGRGFARPALLRLGAVAAGTALLLALLAATPLRIHAEHGFSRDAELVEALSAHPADFFTRPAGALLPPVERPGEFTGGLFPGALVLLLAGLGVASARSDRATRRWAFYALGACAASVVLALGLRLSVGGWRPFELLRALPGFASLRSVFRAAVFAQIHLVMLAGLGMAALLRLGTARLGTRAPALVAVAGALALLENLCLPARLLPLAPAPTAVTSYLAQQAPGTVVAHVPFPASGEVEALAPEAFRMLAQLQHRQPLVNGYASNFPALVREFMFAMGGAFPDHQLACALKVVFQTDLVVIDRAWLDQHAAAVAGLGPLLTPVFADPTAVVFRLSPAPGECPPMRLDVGAR
jgi:hypothetical protein